AANEKSFFQDNVTWSPDGTAAFDFRGDVRTTPTAEMLEAVAHSSMGDGVEGSDLTTNSLQDYMAAITGHEAALFVLSGTMGNILALRSHLTSPPYAILGDSRAHFLSLEAGGTLFLTGATPQPIQPSNKLYITLEDIKKHVTIDDGIRTHGTPTRVIVLENTLRGILTPFHETKRICEYAHDNGIKVHLDGARLWEVIVATTKSPSNYTSALRRYCRLFDTVTMCFSKGLGAPVGSILVGTKSLIRQATLLRHSIGGSIRMPGLLTACAFVAVKTTFEGGLLRRTHELAKQIATFWEEKCGGRLLFPTDTNMVWLDFSGQNFTLGDLRVKAQEKGLIIFRERLIFHYRKFYIIQSLLLETAKVRHLTVIKRDLSSGDKNARDRIT
ncbi:Aldolase, partial [Lachnellula occidentalis]